MSRLSTAVLVLLLTPSPAAASVPVQLVPPVDGAVVRGFETPAHEFGPGHRGIDLAAAPGTPVRAAAAGTVEFAGPVAGTKAVTLAHPGGLETTYSQLAEVVVERGDLVQQGTWLGTTGDAHQGVSGLHLGARLRGRYVDPSALLVALDLSGALRLAPLLWEPSSDVPETLAAALRPSGPGSAERPCREPRTRPTGTSPNGNIAVAVAGIGSKTEGPDAADMYHPGPAFFGYPADRVYRFSYRGARDHDLHEDYPRTDTYGDIRGAARKLGALLRAISERHPGAKVDLIAHSQGGIVARAYLTEVASRSSPGLPRVEHLVTFASPHTGAPIAGNVDYLRSETRTGPLLLAAARKAAAAGAPIPDPTSPAVAQLAPDSLLLQSLARRDVAYGTRVLTLGIADDLVVPADRTAMVRGRHHVIGPQEPLQLGGHLLPGNGHSAIVTAPSARAVVYDFLRGAAPACPTAWDTWGVQVGRAISGAEARLGRALEIAEGLGGRAVHTVLDLLGRGR